MQERIFVKFPNSSSPMNISELLTSAGYPPVRITENRRYLAYECILLYEVITKCIPALDDLGKGLASVKVSQTTLLDLLGRLTYTRTQADRHTYIHTLFQKQTIYTNKTKKKSTSRKGSLEVSPMRKIPSNKRKTIISIHKSRSLESNI